MGRRSHIDGLPLPPLARRKSKTLGLSFVCEQPLRKVRIFFCALSMAFYGRGCPDSYEHGPRCRRYTEVGSASGSVRPAMPAVRDRVNQIFVRLQEASRWPQNGVGCEFIRAIVNFRCIEPFVVHVGMIAGRTGFVKATTIASAMSCLPIRPCPACVVLFSASRQGNAFRRLQF